MRLALAPQAIEAVGGVLGNCQADMKDSHRKFTGKRLRIAPYKFRLAVFQGCTIG
jgi:hypothetical protein